ncbi:hypothetical protein SAMN03097699_0820 [Flavobacteriaceae bacterium MAR_2010_188]|nr:hypothetical protein SAMN03097699_0820 [Flavobacteriaceae bacterium MAR_2010_188]
MNKDILNKDNQDFIHKNLESDLNAILLSKAFQSIPLLSELISQIEAKKRCESKLPTWYDAPLIYFPDKLNIEQTSSEKTAEYKSKLIQGKVLIDLTSGFGVDDYYFSKVFEKVYACEINQELAEISAYNLKILKVDNIEVVNQNGLDFLKNQKGQIDAIYIDPSRRHDTKGKIFRFNESEPDVTANLRLFFEKASTVLIKSSPLVDLSSGIKDLRNVSAIHIIALNNEVKELLWLVKKDFKGKVKVLTRNITKKIDENYNFCIDDELTTEVELSEPLHYLYEPNAAILKSGGFKIISEDYKIKKLNLNSHLYTSNELKKFPGRIFKVLKWQDYNKKKLKRDLPKKANISIRNFPKSVEQIRKELKISDGGEHYLFFTTDLHNNKIVIECEKV